MAGAGEHVKGVGALVNRDRSNSVLARGTISSCSAAIIRVGAVTFGANLQDSNLSLSSHFTGISGYWMAAIS